MFSTRPLPPIGIFPADDCNSSEDFNSVSSQSSPSPSAFDVKFETPFVSSALSDCGDLWFSMLGDKGVVANPPDCLQDFDIDEGYLDQSSAYSSGVLSPDLDFLGFKSIKEFDVGSGHKGLQTPNFQSFDLCRGPSELNDPRTTRVGEELAFDDCCLLSMPSSPAVVSSLDILFPFPSLTDTFQSPRSPYSSDHYQDKRDGQELSSCLDDFDVSCLGFEKFDTSSSLDPHRMSDDIGNNSNINNNSINNSNKDRSTPLTDSLSRQDPLANPDLLSAFFNDDQSFKHDDFDCLESLKCTSGPEKGKSQGRPHAHREDHGYAAKLPAVTTHKLKRKGFSRSHDFSKSSSHSSKLQRASSILELFLTSNRTIDPNKGSNAALASELRRYERTSCSKPERLLKKLLTTDLDRRRNEARH